MALIIADIGSCHMGKQKYIEEAIDIAKELGIWVLKFQLFKGIQYTTAGNIPLPYEWWPEIMKYAKEKEQLVTSSVFDMDGLNMLIESDVPFIKISFSKSQDRLFVSKACGSGKDIILSTNHLNKRKTYPWSLPADLRECYVGTWPKTLYCIPEYPVPYHVDFNGISRKFDGFSDHTIGVGQTMRAINAGVEIIEKHMTLNHDDINCPDTEFAITPGEMQQLVDYATVRRGR